MSNPYLEGNQHAKKLDTPDLRREAYTQYCAHIAKGLSKKAFVFDHPELSITWETMEKYIREDPIEFDPKYKQMAEARSLEVWESTGIQMMIGQIEKCQPAIYQMFMRNKFGWDKNEQSNNAAETDVRRLLEQMDKKA